MKTVTVSKSALRAKIEENRSLHRKIFEEALDGWKKEVLAEVGRLYDSAKSGAFPKTVMVHLPRPDDHTKDFDRALQMIDMEIDTEVILSQGDFANLVQNQWDWMDMFLARNSRYSSTARAISDADDS